MAPRSAGSSSLDVGRSAAEAYIAKLKADGEIRKIRRAIKGAKPSRCPRAKTIFHVYSTGTKKAYEIPCGSWRCDVCGWGKQRVAAYMVFHGMLRAHNEGQKVRFMTLTENPANPLTVRDLSAAWNRLRTRLKNAGLLDQYAAVVETTKRGRPHLHVVFTGSFVPQRRLSQMAEQVGFGRVADIRLVSFNPDDQEDQAAKNTARYVAKELSGYVSKAGGDAAGKLVAYRRRPLRTSRGWFPGGMAEAKRRWLAEVAERTDWEPDPGGFFFVANNPETGTLRIQGSTPTGETFTLADRADADGPVERSQASRSEDERQETSTSSATHPRKRHKRGQEREKRAGLSSGRALSRHERKRSKQRRDTRRRRERPETEVQAGAEARAGPSEEER